MININVRTLQRKQGTRKQGTRKQGTRHQFTVMELGKGFGTLLVESQKKVGRPLDQYRLARSETRTRHLGGEVRLERTKQHSVFVGQFRNLLHQTNVEHDIVNSMVVSLQRRRPQVIDRILEVLLERMKESSGSPLNGDSLNSAAHFLVHNSDLTDPNVRLTAEGNLVFGWTLAPDGLLVLLFRPDQTVIYSGGVGPGRLSSGTVHRDDLRQNLRQFEEWLTTS